MQIRKTTRSTSLLNTLDWSVISLRWLALLALTMSLAVGKTLAPGASLTLLVATIWNIALTGLAILGQRVRAHRYASVAGDLILAMMLFWLSGGLGGRMEWAGILPLLSTALYFGVGEVLLVAAVTLAIQAAILLLTQPLRTTLVLVGTLLPLYLAAGLLLNYVAQKMMVRAGQKERLEQQKLREVEKVQAERRRTTGHLVSTLNASLDFQHILDTALDLSASYLDETGGQPAQLVSAVLLSSSKESGGTELRVAGAHGFSTSDQRAALPGIDGLVGQVIAEKKPGLSKGPLKDPELNLIAALHACQSAYCIPLLTGMDVRGVLLFAHPDLDYFTADRREFLDALGGQASIALQNARRYQDLEREKERMMEIQEDSRKKLARDLHDGPTQSVAALAMRVNFARRLLERDPKGVSEELTKAEELARQATKEIRHMLFTLRPLVLESQGLVAALESMAEKMRETYNQNMLVEATPEVVTQVEPGKQGVIFYIIEEAVNNARKHAGAANIWVRLKLDDEDLVQVEIQDDGKGFSAPDLDSGTPDSGSLGMMNMRERTELLKGDLRIDSEEGKGTRVSLLVPLSDAAASRLRDGE